MDKEERGILCLLHSLKGLGNRSLSNIKEEFGSFKACFTADLNELQASFLPVHLVEAILACRRKEDPLEYLERILNRGIKVLAREDDDYPSGLRWIHNPPEILYYRGQLDCLQKVCIAVVGSRAATAYGRNMARNLSRQLAERGITVISGMARGIDAEAHQGAIDKQGFTAAVLGSGIDVVYPRENRSLYDQICHHGLVFSEYPPGTPPEAGNFPVRNRIISGLSRGVVVVEAKTKSGALITTEFALEQGKDVFAVPGPVHHKTSEGPHNLIKQGAILITSVQDIIDEYFDLQPVKTRQFQYQEELLLLDDEERIVVDAIESEPYHFDQIVEKTKLEIGKLSEILLNLEFRGIVKSLPGNYYLKI